MFELLFQSTPLLFAGVIVFGLIIGSFLNVVIFRVPPLLEHDWRCQCRELLQLKPDEDERPPGIVSARSKCPDCGHLIRAIENIPVLSYLVLRGRCAACKARISLRYPLVELTTRMSEALLTMTAKRFGGVAGSLFSVGLLRAGERRLHVRILRYLPPGEGLLCDRAR